MRVFEHHQDGPGTSEPSELANQRLQQKLPLTLRGEIEIGGGIRQGEELGDQLELVGAFGGVVEQRVQFLALFLGCVLADKITGAFESALS